MHWIIDTDAGVDDAIAIAMPFVQGRYPHFQLAAITTVAGNVGLDKVNVNVGALIDLLELDVPFYSGCARALIAKHEHAEDFHGADGLGGNGLAQTNRKPTHEHAAQAIVRLAKQYAGDLGILALGPLTNIALAFNLDPELPRRLGKFVVMGGAWQGRGNQTSAAEFNIAVDPESAHAVFARSPEIWLAPWEAALAHGWPYERMARVFRCNTRRSQFLAQMTEKIAPKLRDTFRLPTFPCPDPLAMALVLDESVVAQSVRARIHVDIAHGHGRGLTTLAYRDAVPNTTVMTHVDEAKFFDMLEAAWS